MDASPPIRRIWLCADDYGIAPGVSSAIRDLIARGRLNATSVMSLSPNFTHAEADSLSQLAADGHRVAIGLHVTLTQPFQPLTSDYRPVRRGAFPSLGATLGAAMVRRLDRVALSAEIEAQFEAFVKAFGRLPDFVDGHQHVHLFPTVREAFLAAAGRLAPEAWVRQCGWAARPERLGDPKGLLIDRLSRGFRARAEAAGIATNPAFAGTYTFKGDADFASAFPGFLRRLPDGGLIMCHPGFVDDELARLDPLTHLREREYAYLISDLFPATLQAHRAALA
jgi:predicted glycoside hydrolase/deacetylase ChbG (UPF0249 family)